MFCLAQFPVTSRFVLWDNLFQVYPAARSFLAPHHSLLTEFFNFTLDGEAVQSCRLRFVNKRVSSSVNSNHAFGIVTGRFLSIGMPIKTESGPFGISHQTNMLQIMARPISSHRYPILQLHNWHLALKYSSGIVELIPLHSLSA